jgi:hypothetical protein
MNSLEQAEGSEEMTDGEYVVSSRNAQATPAPWSGYKKGIELEAVFPYWIRTLYSKLL